MNISETLVHADKETLHEIIREAESYLSSQLTAGIAADQRAIAFAGLLSAAAVVLVSGALTVLLGTTAHSALGWIGLACAIGLLVAVFLANMTAMPADFWYPGNSPAQWVNDIREKKVFLTCLAEQAQHYAEQIDDNKKLLDRNGKGMQRAVWLAWGVLMLGAALSAISVLF